MSPVLIDEFASTLDRLTAMGLSVGLMTSQQLAERERAYAKVWANIIKTSGFQPQ